MDNRKIGYVLQLFGDVEPILHGPFTHITAMLNCAKQLHRYAPDDGVFKIYAQGPVEVHAYTGKELE